MFDANRLLNQLTGARGGDVRVREGQQDTLGSILGGLAGGGTGGASGSGLGALLGGLTGGMTGAGSGGMGAPAAGGSAGGSSLGGSMGGGLRDAGAGSRSDYGTSAGGNLSDTRGGGGIGDMLSGALGPGGLLSGGMGKGAMAAGLVGMLMKSGSPKKMMSSGLKLGGLALVGGLAYKAYQAHQAGQQVQPQGAIEPPPQESAFAPDTEAEKQDHARAMIRAMVAAAKADGHVDAEEQQRLFGAMDTLDLDNDDKAFLMDELRAPLDIRSVAAEARTPEMAAEIYVASLLVCDEVDADERRYLDRLAEAMSLPRDLVAQLEAQVNAALEA